MWRKPVAVVISAVLLSAGWTGYTGFTLLFALVPILWISSSLDGSRRSWWRMFGWALFTFVLWNAMTIWWIWHATPVGPFAATLVSSFLNMVAFMLYHTVSKKGPRPLAYTLLVAGWIATEYWYTIGEFSWPWLVFGNGFSHDIWAVQWYEYTGVFGGTLWVLLCNILIFEAVQLRSRASYIKAAVAVVAPLLISAAIWYTYKAPSEGTVKVSIIQPNVDAYGKFDGNNRSQERNIINLIDQVPSGVQFIVLPETAVPGYYWEPALSPWRYPDTTGQFWAELTDTLRRKHPEAMLITGANTNRSYAAGSQTRTARKADDGSYYDHFNSAVGLDSAGQFRIHHKGRLVIGAEKTPLPWLFELLDFLVIDLGGTLGQLGVGQHGTVFEHNGVGVGPAICYEGIYGDFYGDFVRRGADAMFIISNDGWWGDTPGYKHLFTISRLRAIEHRRSIARCANTGISGFIDQRGNIGQSLGWEKRGILTDTLQLDSRQTFYTRYGDYLGRISEYLMLLCILYYVAYRYKRRNHLVK